MAGWIRTTTGLVRDAVERVALRCIFSLENTIVLLKEGKLV